MDWLKMPPLYALKAFESAARHQSFTQAANELSITQSAISKHIHTLEVFFGRRLFERKGPRVLLTPDGECFAKEIQLSFTSLCIACEQFSGERDMLQIRAPTTFSLRWLIAIIRKLYTKKDYPMVGLDSNGLNLECIDFNGGKYDGAIQYGNGDFPKEWEVTRLLDEWLIPVCAPGVLPRCGDINGLRINLLYSKSKADHWSLWCEGMRGDIGLKVAHKNEFDSMDFAISAAVHGLGVAIVDINMVMRELENKTLVLPFKNAVRTGNGYYFVWPKNHIYNKNIILLNDFLKNEIIEERVDSVNYIE
ncbi:MULTISPECIES: LysR family transcriptional regulator [unclassified Brenneria]|uniref:LysR family transcriptional regulator n=1 Tax=unclassified Brenneria TaxID=2634434 RepID=UPI001553DC1F|nr:MULTISPECIES: LysR family transcriptional regulator [unclassified Brenneria]MBJ7221992.1 LysR family transcriptional regulator [Brenneria sp. L3-3C-1]MEE3643235.1 LysR family transcriptional regulator [Brenneria sp. L3_3C_1]MEE3650576.1 LysR family transcriptional regulator [Brenneria sp. HEZEL_4_2_4]NPD00531.1 LysR family transcriptional regulator [Brenneria sp. hezel4-2-4]